MRTLIRDLYKNLAEVPEGVLSVSLRPPSGEPETLLPTNQPRGGLTAAYDVVRYEPRYACTGSKPASCRRASTLPVMKAPAH